MGVPGLPDISGAVCGADCPGRANDAAQLGAAGLVRDQPATGPGSPGAGVAGLYWRRLGRHRHGDCGQRGTVDHGVQRHVATVVVAPQKRRAPVRSIPLLDAIGAPRVDRGHPAAGVCQLPSAGFHGQPGHHRANFLRGGHSTGARNAWRAVLETSQPPGCFCRVGDRYVYMVLHPGAAADRPQHGLASKSLSGAGVAAQQPAGSADHPADTGRGAVAGR